MTYYLYHIPGKKIGGTRDLKYRVEEQQGYGPGEYSILMKSKNIDYVSDQEIYYQTSLLYCTHLVGILVVLQLFVLNRESHRSFFLVCGIYSMS